MPGVSSFCGAAAVLNAEYTLPGVSQTVILSRMEGRTPVPPDEDIERLASHKASMVLFLTTSMLEKLSEKLVKGGYKPDTPAAIVYKATWPEQKIVHTTIAELYKSAKENNITKTALILVGIFFLVSTSFQSFMMQALPMNSGRRKNNEDNLDFLYPKGLTLM